MRCPPVPRGRGRSAHTRWQPIGARNDGHTSGIQTGGLESSRRGLGRGGGRGRPSAGRPGRGGRLRVAGGRGLVVRTAIIGDIEARSFEQQAGATAHPPLNLPLPPLFARTQVLGAMGQRRIADPLGQLELRVAFLTEIFVGRHRRYGGNRSPTRPPSARWNLRVRAASMVARTVRPLKVTASQSEGKWDRRSPAGMRAVEGDCWRLAKGSGWAGHIRLGGRGGGLIRAGGWVGVWGMKKPDCVEGVWMGWVCPPWWAGGRTGNKKAGLR